MLSENVRVKKTVDALLAGDLPTVGRLLSASHASLRDQYEVSTAAVEATVERLLRMGASGARIVGGGFGGHVLGLLAPNVCTPKGAREVYADVSAHLLDAQTTTDIDGPTAARSMRYTLSPTLQATRDADDK